MLQSLPSIAPELSWSRPWKVLRNLKSSCPWLDMLPRHNIVRETGCENRRNVRRSDSSSLLTYGDSIHRDAHILLAHVKRSLIIASHQKRERNRHAMI
eukprot:717054-Amphidinium_carterae.1